MKVRTLCCSIVSAGKGLSGGVIGGISVGIVAALLLLVFCVYVKCYRRRKMWNKKLVAKDSSENFVLQGIWISTYILSNSMLGLVTLIHCPSFWRNLS